MTRSPIANPRAPGPSAATRPENSPPGENGGFGLT